jgi:hypothetical protein
MHLLSTTLLLPLLTTAHFVMHYPTSRNGDDDEIEVNSPCSGKPVSDNRTTVSLPTFPIALEMGHEETVIQILLSLSDNPTEDDFNITLERTFQQDGLGEFCLPNVRVPESANVKAGDKATVQVVTDGEGGGGLYVVSHAFALTFSSSFFPWLLRDSLTQTTDSSFSVPTWSLPTPSKHFQVPARTTPA